MGVVELQRQQEAMSRAKVEEEKLEKEREIDAAKNKSRMLGVPVTTRVMMRYDTLACCQQARSRR